jgi:hypothetical protein
MSGTTTIDYRRNLANYRERDRFRAVATDVETHWREQSSAGGGAFIVSHRGEHPFTSRPRAKHPDVCNVGREKRAHVLEIPGVMV